MRHAESFCKINLFLRVAGRRADGFHTLETLFWPLETPSDTLDADFDASPGIALETGDAGIPADSGNLVCRAAARYAEAAGIAPTWRFRLVKRVPVAAGLGGGSADAAAALRLLEERFGALGEARLRELALRIGADVPFFLDPRPAAARGVGELVEPLTGKVPHLPLVLVDPGFPVSAKWAYGQYDAGSDGAGRGTLEAMLGALASGDVAGVARQVRNDLAPALWRKFPVLALIRAELTKLGAHAVEVSGSGPALFALMPDDASARNAAAVLNEKRPRWRTIVAEDKL